MSGTRYRAGRPAARQDSGLLGDMAAWNRAHCEDNSERIERLRRNLRLAQRVELTPRQAEMIHLYYDLGYNQSQIARELGIYKSSVSRTLKRGRERLKRYLKYSL